MGGCSARSACDAAYVHRGSWGLACDLGCAASGITKVALHVFRNAARNVLLHERLIGYVERIGALLNTRDEVRWNADRDRGRCGFEIGKRHGNKITFLEVVGKVDAIPKLAFVVFILECWDDELLFWYVMLLHIIFFLFY